MKKSLLKKVNTIDDLNELGIGRVIADISHRGGGLGFYARDVAEAFKVPVEYLPGNFGAGCNYLGGGVRGAIFASGFDKMITGRKAELLNELSAACIRAYEHAEGEMNNELDEDGDTNWDAVATKASRRAGITSAY